MKTIALTKNKVTQVDDQDYEWLSAYSWHLSNYGYARAEKKVDGKRIRFLMHRLIMNARKGHIIDHINGDRLDNRRANLRFVTRGQSAMNRSSKNQFKGCYWFRGAYSVYVQLEGQRIFIGREKNIIDAAEMYNAAAKELHGPYARLNVIPK